MSSDASRADHAMAARTASRAQTMPESTLKEKRDGEKKSEEGGEEKSQEKVV